MLRLSFCYKEENKNVKRSRMHSLARRGVLSAVCAVLFFLSATALLWGPLHASRQEKAQNNLLPSTAQSTVSSKPAQESTDSPAVLPQYEELVAQNPDMVGWVRIDGTGIDYPVMYTGDDFYLEHDFDRCPSQSGVPYIDKRCSVEPFGTNTIVYAHNMKNGSMFARLLRYQDKRYYEQHPTIRFDTLYKEQEYDILAVFESKVYKKSDTVFKHYNFLNAQSEQEFEKYIQGIQAQALYDTGVTAQYGDELITLMTCAYHTENGRFVVVAKKKSAE